MARLTMPMPALQTIPAVSTPGSVYLHTCEVQGIYCLEPLAMSAAQRNFWIGLHMGGEGSRSRLLPDFPAGPPVGQPRPQATGQTVAAQPWPSACRQLWRRRLQRRKMQQRQWRTPSCGPSEA